MEDDDGRWRDKPGEVAEVIEAYLKFIFPSSNSEGSSIDLVLNLVTSRLAPNDSLALEEHFTTLEVKEAAFSIGAKKSPGLDGFHRVFYQKFWHIVGPDVTKVCLDVLNHQVSATSLNSAHLVLISKVKQLCKMCEYMPISLCNVVYKIITKALSNSLRKHLGSIISEYQRAFVPGRLKTDNIAATFEMMHSMKKRNNC